MANSWRLLPNQKGLASGIILCGYGTASFIFNFITLAIVNPNDEKPLPVQEDEITEYYFAKNVYENVPRMFRYLSLIWACLTIIGAILLIPPKKKSTTNSLKIKNQQVSNLYLHFTGENPKTKKRNTLN